MKKKFLAVLTLAILLVFGVAQGAWAATVDSGQCGDDLTWTLDSNGTLTISGSGAMEDYTLEWDYQANESNRTSSAPWGKKGDEVKRIIINSGVTNIGANAFYFFNNLEQLDISNSVYIIGDDAFSYCKKIEFIDIPNGVKYIEKDAFQDCISLETLKLSASVIRVDTGMFSSCEGLRDITVDDNNTQYASYNGALYDKEKLTLLVYPAGRNYFEIYSGAKNIGKGAFNSCQQLTEIEIPDNVEEFYSNGSPIFRGCTSLKKVTLSKNMIGSWSALFENCSNLTEVIFPERLADNNRFDKTHYFNFSFSGCTNLKEVKIPENVSRLQGTFLSCENLETVYLPASLKEIGINTFYRCYNLKKIVYAGNETQWGTIDIDKSNVELANVEMVFLNNSGTTEPEQPDKPDKPTNPDKPTTPEKPGTLSISSRPGGLGSKLTVQVEGGHWLTVQVRRAGSIAITSVQAPGTGMVSLTFSAAAGSTVQVWETETEMTFSNGVPNNKILAVNVRNV